MINFYIIGVFIVLILMIVRIIIGIAVATSIRAKNMKKLGLHYNFFVGNFTKEKQPIFSKLLSIFYLVVIEPLLSWISLGFMSWKWISSFANKTPIPEYLKEFQFKLAHVDMTKDEIEKMGREMAKRQGVTLAEDEPDEENIITEDNNGFFYQHSIFPSKQQIHYYYHSPDYETENHSIYEYNITDLKIKMRLVESYDQDPRQSQQAKQYEVRDNVVLENEIRERIGISRTALKNTNEIIDRLKKDIEWHELVYYKLRYLILGRHPEIIATSEYRKYLRQELERILNGVQSISKIAIDNGFIVKEFEIGGLSPDIPNDIVESKQNDLKDKYDKLFTDILFNQYGLTKNEFNDSHNIQEYLKQLLGD